MEGVSLGYWRAARPRRSPSCVLAGGTLDLSGLRGPRHRRLPRTRSSGASTSSPSCSGSASRHAGTLISAILFLFRAKWRNAINRSAEAMTVIAVLTAAQFLGIHVGRIWKSYFILPYPNQRGLWVELQEPAPVGHVRDHDLRDDLDRVPLRRPDPRPRDRARPRDGLAQAALHGRSRSAGRARRASGRRTTAAVLHLSGLATPLVLSVHSVVSWDFADVDRARLARHDLRALLRGGRDLLRLRDGARR